MSALRKKLITMRASRARRLKEKNRKSEIKQMRKMDPGEWE